MFGGPGELGQADHDPVDEMGFPGSLRGTARGCKQRRGRDGVPAGGRGLFQQVVPVVQGRIKLHVPGQEHRGGLGVVSGAVRVAQLDAERIATVLQGTPGTGQVLMGHLHGAQSPGQVEVRQRQSRTPEFGAEESGIESEVVRDDDGSGQSPVKLRSDIDEARCLEDVPGADPVDGLLAQVPFGVDQRFPSIQHGAGTIEGDDGNFRNAVVVAREQSGGLRVDHCEISLCHGGSRFLPVSNDVFRS